MIIMESVQLFIYKSGNSSQAGKCSIYLRVLRKVE